LARAVEEEDAFDWTGRGGRTVEFCPPRPVERVLLFDGTSQVVNTLLELVLSNLPPGISIEFDADPAVPETTGDQVSGEALVHLGPAS
jgi:hypothetical protein